MKPKIKQLWIDALRSGKYKQGSGQLRDGDEYCCLGVLCEVYRNRTKHGKWEDGRFVVGKFDELYVLPPPVYKWAGLDGNDEPQNPMVCHRHEHAFIAKYNDDRYAFPKIADLIEKHL